MARKTVALIPGDGIGPEVIDSARQVLAAVDANLDFVEYAVSGRRYAATGTIFEDGELEAIKASDAILFGAMGHPTVQPGILERGVILELRFGLDLGVNLRPARLLPGEESPVKNINPEEVDWLFVRENTEGLYSGSGGRFQQGTTHELALQDSINTYRSVERAVGFAFEKASQRKSLLTWVHKTNVLLHAAGLWQRVVNETAVKWPGVEVNYEHADAACIHMVHDPGRYDVVVTDNLFGDMLTDLSGALTGGIGLSATANINPAAPGPGFFEPAHGSAPDIAGRGLANPVAAVQSAALMLEDLGGEQNLDKAQRIDAAVLRISAAGKLHGNTAAITAALLTELA